MKDEGRKQNGSLPSSAASIPQSSAFILHPSSFDLPSRIRHIDSLRAVAAGLVVWAHLFDSLEIVTTPGPAWLGFLRTLPRPLNVGRLGVMVFFAISGFVICRSFGGPRAGGARRFVIKRLCRLYPAYWVSMLGGLWLCWLESHPATWLMVAANATMVPSLFGQPYLLGVYWTLEIELLFYVLCLGLYGLRWLDRPAVLATGAALLAFTPRLVKMIGQHAGTHWVLSQGQPTLVFSLALMLWGALFRLVYDETGGFRRDPLRHPHTWLLLGVGLALIDLPDPNIKWFLLGLHRGQIPSHLVVVSAMLIFTLWVAWWRIDNRVLTYLGVISYSLYLFHAVILYTLAHWLPLLGGWTPPFWLGILVGLPPSIALAAMVYRWVERPAIALGKRWTTTRLPNGTVARQTA